MFIYFTQQQFVSKVSATGNLWVGNWEVYICALESSQKSNKKNIYSSLNREQLLLVTFVCFAVKCR